MAGPERRGEKETEGIKDPPVHVPVGYVRQAKRGNIPWTPRCSEEYKKAGFNMLPMNTKDKGAVKQIIFYTESKWNYRFSGSRRTGFAVEADSLT